MSFTIEKFDTWNLHQSKHREVLGISDSKMKCYPYCGVGHALVDIIYGLKHFWPTRKSIIISPWGSPFISESIKGCLTEGFNVITLRKEALRQQIEAHAQQIKDILVVVLVRDHCVTGEIITQDEELKHLNDNKIPFIEIQNNWSWSSRSILPSSFGAQIRVIDAQKVMTLFGGRFRLSTMSAALMDWSQIEWENQIIRFKSDFIEDSVFIQDFELKFKSLQQKVEFYSDRLSLRLFDRIIFEAKGVDGVLYLERLLMYLKLKPLGAPGFETRCETTNLSRWEGGLPCWPWWGELALTESQQRSLVVLSLNFIKGNSISPDTLNKVYLDCYKEITFS